jgi:hypothetical protein
MGANVPAYHVILRQAPITTATEAKFLALYARQVVDDQTGDTLLYFACTRLEAVGGFIKIAALDNQPNSDQLFEVWLPLSVILMIKDLNEKRAVRIGFTTQ